jgi:hypothetical protein
MTGAHRSIVITFGRDDPVVRSDLDFHRKLTDMRERYPSWSIRGITHDRERLIPEKPRAGTLPLGGGDCSDQVRPEPLGASSPGLPEERDELQDTSCVDDLRSDDSTGNVVGQAPQEVRVGLRVRLMVAPYSGRSGVVVAVRNENRFQVSIVDDSVRELGSTGGGSACTWWCSSDDVVVDRPESGIDEPAVSLSTLELMVEVRKEKEALQRDVARYRAAFQKLRLTVGEELCDAVLASVTES